MGSGRDGDGFDDGIRYEDIDDESKFSYDDADDETSLLESDDQNIGRFSPAANLPGGNRFGINRRSSADFSTSTRSGNSALTDSSSVPSASSSSGFGSGSSSRFARPGVSSMPVAVARGGDSQTAADAGNSRLARIAARFSRKKDRGDEKGRSEKKRFRFGKKDDARQESRSSGPAITGASGTRFVSSRNVDQEKKSSGGRFKGFRLPFAGREQGQQSVTTDALRNRSDSPALTATPAQSGDRASGGLFARFRRGNNKESKERPVSQSKPRTDKTPEAQSEGLSLDTKLDILGIGLVFGAFVLFFSAISNTQAAISGFHVFLGQLLGWGAFVVPFTMLGVGLWLIVRHFGEYAPMVDPVRVSGLISGVISLLVLFQFIDSFNYIGIVDAQGAVNLSELEGRLRESYEIHQAGGGWVGAQLYFLLVANLNEIGGFVLLVFALILSAMLLTRSSASEIAIIAISLWRNLRTSLNNRAAARRMKRLSPQPAIMMSASHVSPSAPVLQKSPSPSRAVYSQSQMKEDIPIEDREILIRKGGRQLTLEEIQNRSKEQTEKVGQGGLFARVRRNKRKLGMGVTAADRSLPQQREETSEVLDKSEDLAESPIRGIVALKALFRRSQQGEEAGNKANEVSVDAKTADVFEEMSSTTRRRPRFFHSATTSGGSEKGIGVKRANPRSAAFRHINPGYLRAKSTKGAVAASPSAEIDMRENDNVTEAGHEKFVERESVSTIARESDAAPTATYSDAELSQQPQKNIARAREERLDAIRQGQIQPAKHDDSPVEQSENDAGDLAHTIPAESRQSITFNRERSNPAVPLNSEKRANSEAERAQVERPISRGPANQTRRKADWRLPDYRALLTSGSEQQFDREHLLKQAKVIEDTLNGFGAPGRVVEVNTGPVITQFGVEPDYITNRSGKKSRVKVGSIAQLDKDLQLALGAKSIRVEAPVPGKGYVGIEVPNDKSATVSLRDVMESEAFKHLKSPLRIALGHGVDGTPVVADLTSMPHLLIAGTTGSGKSVCVNAVIASLCIRNKPDQVKFIMIDPKRVELTAYNGLPHLIAPVVVDLEKTISVLKWVTREMDERYKKFSEIGARNIVDYNKKRPGNTDELPYIVVIVDELADLMMMSPEETERLISRMAALARATGIHLVIATQRPSVDVVTGLIKANFPARIAFAVASGVDSRVILDQPGAEKLLGKGDMLYLSGNAPAPLRLQGVFVSDTEIHNIVRYWRMQAVELGVAPNAVPRFEARPSIFPSNAKDDANESSEQAFFWDEFEGAGHTGFGGSKDSDEDPLYEKAVEMVRRLDKASVSLLQRRLRIGYTRAARLIDIMEERGVVGPAKEGSSKPRDVLPYS